MITAPELDQPYSLAPETIDHYRKHGYALVRGLATPEEVAFYRQRIKASTDEVAKAYAKLEDRDTYGKAFIQNMNLWRHDEAVARFTLAKRFGRVAAELMGVTGVRLYHDHLLVKEPKTVAKTPWHHGPTLLAHLESIDIDTPEDWEFAELAAELHARRGAAGGSR